MTPAGSISDTSVTPAGTISNKDITPAGTIGNTTLTAAQLASIGGNSFFPAPVLPLHSAYALGNFFGCTKYTSDFNKTAYYISAPIQSNAASTSVADKKPIYGYGYSFGSSSSHGHSWTGTKNTHNHTFTGTAANHNHTFTGNSIIINNLPPYKVVYCFKRVS